MATTAAGTPYVESSDLVANYPGVSLALANHIDDTGGKVLQVVSVTKVDAFTTTSTSFVDVTGLTASITPSATSSTILVLAKIAVNPRSNSGASTRLLRGATVIGGGTAVGSRFSAMSGFYVNTIFGTGDVSTIFMDSPASNANQTYKIQVRVGAGTLGVNTLGSDSDDSGSPRTSSTITLMEIGV
jgi:hypothetical protein